MPPFLIALIVVVGGLWLIRKAARTSQAAMPAFIRKISAGGIMAFAGVLAMRGMLQIAVPLFLFGLGLAGKSAIFPNGFGWSNNRAPGQKSRVATSLLAMELDHDTATMEGEILAGQLKGRKLSSLTQEERMAFHAQCKSASDQSLPLFEAWLDRANPEWRNAWGGQKSNATPSGNTMSRQEALNVLGLKEGASPAEIKTAHKKLMMNFHPDRGGSDYLAAKINAAKDVLLA